MTGDRLRLLPDQGAKLDYLIYTRGDRRPPVQTSRHIAKTVMVRDQAGDPKPRIRNQDGLALELGYDKSRVSDWVRDKSRIPDHVLLLICAIYAVGEQALRSWTFAEFEEGCRRENFDDKPDFMAAASSRWRALLRERAVDGPRLLLADPYGDPFAPTARTDLRYAVDADAPESRLPEVPSETPFWLALASPQDEDGGLSWTGWHCVVFNHDRQLDGFACLRAEVDGASRATLLRFPERRTLHLPGRAGWRHPSTDRGIFAIVATLSRHPVPKHVAEPLGAPDVHGTELEPGLRELAAWLAHQPEPDIAIVSVAYRVVVRNDAGDR